VYVLLTGTRRIVLIKLGCYSTYF